VTVGGTLSEHLAQLERLVTGEPDLRDADRFISQFVRPLAMNRSATIEVCDALERIARVTGASSADGKAIAPQGADAVSGPT